MCEYKVYVHKHFIVDSLLVSLDCQVILNNNLDLYFVFSGVTPTNEFHMKYTRKANIKVTYKTQITVMAGETLSKYVCGLSGFMCKLCYYLDTFILICSQ